MRASASDDIRAEIAAAEQLVEIEKDSGSLRILAGAVGRSGDRRRALKLWYEVIELSPNDYEALRNIADRHAEQGEVELACAAMKRALAVPPSQPVGRGTVALMRVFGRLFRRDFVANMEEDDKRTNKDRRRWQKWAEEYLRVHDREEPREWVN